MAGLLGDPVFWGDVRRGLLDAGNRGVAGLLGGPVDLAALAMRPFGYSTQNPVGGSEWIGQKMQDAGIVSGDRNLLAEGLASLVLPAAAARLPALVEASIPSKINTLASKSPRMSDPKPQPQTPFEKDYPRDKYPQGSLGPDGSRLSKDIDGRAIDPGAAIFGRRTVGGVDEGASGGDIAATADRFGTSVVRVKPAEIGGDAGRYERSFSNDGVLQRAIKIAHDVDETQLSNVLRHELGHLVDDAAMGYRGTKTAPVSIPEKGVTRELAQNYSELNTPYRVAKWQWGATPESQNYKKTEWTGERLAEAIRSYMQDPNAFKAKFPGLAKVLRQHVNTNENLNKVIHLNTAAGLGLLANPLEDR